MEMKRLGFIGGGVMASALIEGILRAGLLTSEKLIASDPAQATR